MILVNTSANSVNADLHFVPTIHLQNTDRASVMATIGQVGTIAKGLLVLNAAAPLPGVVLVPWPAHRGWRRPAEAGHHGTGAGHPRDRGSAGQPRS